MNNATTTSLDGWIAACFSPAWFAESSHLACRDVDMWSVNVGNLWFESSYKPAARLFYRRAWLCPQSAKRPSISPSRESGECSKLPGWELLNQSSSPDAFWARKLYLGVVALFNATFCGFGSRGFAWSIGYGPALKYSPYRVWIKLSGH